ncbi:MAG: alpha/beta hydrolase [Candidatus Binatia bacterium]|nr:alpha/beta hydrolase [Candidatus Binatia bacterium]
MASNDLLAGVQRRTVETNGIRMAFMEQGTGPAVVLCHGFPELGYSWRHQMAAVADAGFRVIAPDLRGYGGTDRPEPVADYDIVHLNGDLVGLLDALEIDQAIFVGHDWGGNLVWEMPKMHRDRTAGVIGVNTPALARAPVEPTTIFKMMFGDNFYILHFQQPGIADAGLAKDVRRTFRKLMRSGVPLEQYASSTFREDGKMRNMVDAVEGDQEVGELIVSEEELGVYVDTFERTGFTGGINWYRNFDRNWELSAAWADNPIDVPSLMVTAELDPALRPELAEPMKEFVPDLETVQIGGSGHWTQQEKPDELNRLMVDWLRRRFG